MTINDTNETTQWEDDFARLCDEDGFASVCGAHLFALIKQDRQCVEEEFGYGRGTAHPSMQRLARWVQQAMRDTAASVALIQNLQRRLADAEARLDDLAQANTEPEMSLDERWARSVTILRALLPDAAWDTFAADDD